MFLISLYMSPPPISLLFFAPVNLISEGEFFLTCTIHIHLKKKGFSPLNRLIGTASECFIEVFYFLTIKRCASYKKGLPGG